MPASELNFFQQAAQYLGDPLVLAGFVVFIAFLALRSVLGANIIPPLGKGYGFRILRLMLSYGFVIGLAIVLLGMGLKYQELSETEQANAVSMLVDELRFDVRNLNEMRENATTLSNAAAVVSSTIRHERIPIATMLFPAANLQPGAADAELSGLYLAALDELAATGLWNDALERGRMEQLCGIVVRTNTKVRSTVASLADIAGTRYPVRRQAFDSNLPILRKITLVDVTRLTSLYANMDEARLLYDRIGAGAVEYLDAVTEFCGDLPPTPESLGAVLAAERLVYRLLPAYEKKLIDLATAVDQAITAMADGPGAAMA